MQIKTGRVSVYDDIDIVYKYIIIYQTMQKNIQHARAV